MEHLRGDKNVVLVLGSCRLHDSVPFSGEPSNDTERVISGLEVGGSRVLMLNLRKTCRRKAGDKYCYKFEFQSPESDMLTAMTMLELRIARDVFGIGVRSIVSFAEPWWNQWAFLLRLSRELSVPVVGLPHYHSPEHLGWYGRGASFVNDYVKREVYTREYKKLAHDIFVEGIFPVGVDEIDLYESFRKALPAHRMFGYHESFVRPAEGLSDMQRGFGRSLANLLADVQDDEDEGTAPTMPLPKKTATKYATRSSAMLGEVMPAEVTEHRLSSKRVLKRKAAALLEDDDEAEEADCASEEDPAALELGYMAAVEEDEATPDDETAPADEDGMPESPPKRGLRTGNGKRNAQGWAEDHRRSCQACTAKQCKCDKADPACSRCVRRGFECKYIWDADFLTPAQKKKQKQKLAAANEPTLQEEESMPLDPEI